MRYLAKQGKANAISIKGLFWCDIDDPKSFKQAEDGIRDRSVSRGLGDVYKRQLQKKEMTHFQVGCVI